MDEQKLEAVAANIWCLTSYFLSLGCKGSLRMTVLQTSEGLALYSPVSLTRAQVRQINNLGRVSAIIAPNLYHHLFLRGCAANFTTARVFVPQGLIQKIGPLADAELIDDQTTIAPRDEIEHFTFTGHRIRETILYHRQSRTLITADLLYHYTSDQFFAEKLWFKLIGCYGKPKVAFYHRFSIKEKASVVALVQWVRSRKIDRIIMSHGRIFEADQAGEVFATAWEQTANLT